MSYAGTLMVAAKGDREITMTRRFGAPRAMVFEAWTKPELLKRWMTGPPGMTLPICEVDLRVGGAYRYVWRTSQGQEMGAGGTFLEVAAPERFVATERFDQAWYPGEAVITITFVEQDGETEVTTTMRYEIDRRPRRSAEVGHDGWRTAELRPGRDDLRSRAGSPERAETGMTPCPLGNPPDSRKTRSEIEHEDGRPGAGTADHHDLVRGFLRVGEQQVAMVRFAGEHPGFAGAADPLLAGGLYLEAAGAQRIEDRLAGRNLDPELRAGKLDDEAALDGGRDGRGEIFEMYALGRPRRGGGRERLEHGCRATTIEMRLLRRRRERCAATSITPPCSSST